MTAVSSDKRGKEGKTDGKESKGESGMKGGGGGVEEREGERKRQIFAFFFPLSLSPRCRSIKR